MMGFERQFLALPGSWNESEQVVFYACGRWCWRGCLSNRGPRPIPDGILCVFASVTRRTPMPVARPYVMRARIQTSFWHLRQRAKGEAVPGHGNHRIPGWHAFVMVP